MGETPDATPVATPDAAPVVTPDAASVPDAGNPLRSGFLGAVQNTAVYTFWTVAGTLGGGLAVALLLNRPMPGQKVARTLMLTPWIVPIRRMKVSTCVRLPTSSGPITKRRRSLPSAQ